jgi:superfamily I DNA/RNA helicase
LRYVVSPNTKNVFLKACPGSGKTEVVALKAAFEFRNWNKKNKGVAILAFTNNATDVISERVREYAGIEKTSYPHFVGTIDSWLHRYIAHPFGHLATGYKGRADDRKHDLPPCQLFVVSRPLGVVAPYAITFLVSRLSRSGKVGGVPTPFRIRKGARRPTPFRIRKG